MHTNEHASMDNMHVKVRTHKEQLFSTLLDKKCNYFCSCLFFSRIIFSSKQEPPLVHSFMIPDRRCLMRSKADDPYRHLDNWNIHFHFLQLYVKERSTFLFLYTIQQMAKNGQVELIWRPYFYSFSFIFLTDWLLRLRHSEHTAFDNAARNESYSC